MAEPTQSPIEPAEPRALRVLVIAGSARRLHSRPGLDSKARALMQRIGCCKRPLQSSKQAIR